MFLNRTKSRISRVAHGFNRGEYNWFAESSFPPVKRWATQQKSWATQTLGIVMVVYCLTDLSGFSLAGEFTVTASVETRPTTKVGDADDACIWIHPTDPGLSTIIGTDKENGLNVYDLAGKEIQHVQYGHMNNVDLRYDFPLGGEKVALVTAGNKDKSQTITMFKVNPATRQLIDVADRPLKVKISDVYGSCMYHSPKTGKYYVIVNSFGGDVEQWELFDNGNGKVAGKLVRTFCVGSRTEGCVADDEFGCLYVGEENVGIWKYNAEPEDNWPIKRKLVDPLGPKGHLSDDLNDDIEGLTIYYASDGTGYLIASCQGKDSFVIYKREGNNEYVSTFKIAAGNHIDGVEHTDGIDVTNASLGSAFPQGLFVVQDGTNKDGDETNYKLVPWQSIARAANPNLKIDTSWNPRMPKKLRK